MLMVCSIAIEFTTGALIPIDGFQIGITRVSSIWWIAPKLGIHSSWVLCFLVVFGNEEHHSLSGLVHLLLRLIRR
jgi:hypothetical protein